MEKTISGKVIAINDTPGRLQIGVETKEMVKVEGSQPIPAKSFVISTNDPDTLRGLSVGQSVTISVKSK